MATAQDKSGLTVSLALRALTEHCDTVRRLEQALTEERAERNRLIRNARSAGLTYGTLGLTTGLTREQLSRIINSAD